MAPPVAALGSALHRAIVKSPAAREGASVSPGDGPPKSILVRDAIRCRAVQVRAECLDSAFPDCGAPRSKCQCPAEVSSSPRGPAVECADGAADVAQHLQRVSHATKPRCLLWRSGRDDFRHGPAKPGYQNRCTRPPDILEHCQARGLELRNSNLSHV